ncbi:MAG: segregation/condensation protein A [bacterium]
MSDVSNYTVIIDNFEGPLDLLLALIERQELPVTEVSIGQVTADYLVYTASLEHVSDQELQWFMDIATRLLMSKTRALGMEDVTVSNDIDDDALADLASQLQDLQVIKQAARIVAQHVLPQLEIVGIRGFWEQMAPPNVTSKALIEANRLIVGRQSEVTVQPRHRVAITKLDVPAAIQRLSQLIIQRIALQDITQGSDRRVVVEQFLALLELIKREMVDLVEHKGDLYVQPNAA